MTHDALAVKTKRTHCKNGHPFVDGSFYVAKDGYRQCRKCLNDIHRRRYHERKEELIAIRNTPEGKAKRKVWNQEYNKKKRAEELKFNHKEVILRLMASIKIDESDGGCWEWQGMLNKDGYGLMSVSGLNRAAHRLSYLIFNGEIESHFQIDHLCRNRKCINPEHLDAVLQAENLRRGFGIAGTNIRKQRCPSGHEYSPENTYVNRSNGHRKCRACQRERDKWRYYARKQR